jgi:hypothetical protein
MISLKEYIQINEGVFDVKPVTYKDFVMANQQLELCSLDKANIQDNASIEKIYFNTDLKLPNGSTVKKQVNDNKAMFKKFNLAGFVEGKTDSDMEKLLVKIGKADIEIGDDTYSNNEGTVIVRRLETDETNKIMMIIKFKK